MFVAEAELKALMIAGLTGDPAAQRALLTAVSALLRRYYTRRIGAQEAEDLVQDALIAIHTKRATYDTAQPFTPWLYAIARYKLADHARRAKHRIAVPLDDAGDLLARDDGEAALVRRDLDRLLETLPEPTRQLIREVKIEGRTMQEAAERAGRSEIAVRVGIHRGLKTIMQRLQGQAGRGDE